ncbi:hypothetical protein GOODEAATRI_020923, partial [Goodea atripinnis]
RDNRGEFTAVAERRETREHGRRRRKSGGTDALESYRHRTQKWRSTTHPATASTKRPVIPGVRILFLACLAGFSSRLFAVIRFESIIHEFDPW